MRDVKSLAAEIEAVLRKHHLGKSRVVFGEGGQSIDRVAEAAAEIAANQSRAFEDGARFQTGDAVRKVTGDYRLNGVVVGQATMSTGARRYVVEHRAEGGGSFLHIYAENNLAALQPEGERSDA